MATFFQHVISGFQVWLLSAVVVAGAVEAEEVYLNFKDLRALAPQLYVAEGLKLPPQDLNLPVIRNTGQPDAEALLKRLDSQGAINGFENVLYDNRDRDHSGLRPEWFPRLAFLRYGLDLSARDEDYGLAARILLPFAVIGNSSTALRKGSRPRSLSRLAMTSPGLPDRSHLFYRNNHLYVYPEHRDHDAIDRFPANWPYHVISQGSSGSDRPAVQALVATVAAFQPETFIALRKAGLIAPTLQMILRRNLASVALREDYFTGKAHPVAIPGNQIRPGRMVGHAAFIGPGDIPPVVALDVVEETFQPEAGLLGQSEALFDTPAVIARIWRGFGARHEMIVSADKTEDPNDRPLQFTWALLNGDPERVRIEPLTENGSRARISVEWHSPFAVGGEGSDRRSARVDIGVFASNGAQDSAPSFVSVYFPPHENRVYAEDSDGQSRLVSIGYRLSKDVAFDPVLSWFASWHDEAVYNADGDLLGWNRRWKDNETMFVPVNDRSNYALTDQDGSTPRLTFKGR